MNIYNNNNIDLYNNKNEYNYNIDLLNIIIKIEY